MEPALLKIRVCTVSLQLKFTCRMRVEAREAVTTEVAPAHGLFHFQQELTLRPRTAVEELNIALVTEKGAVYSGGVVRVVVAELRRAGGGTLKLPIGKCIDRQAWVEVEVVSYSEREGEFAQKKDMSFTQKGSFVHYADSPDRNKRGNLVVEANLGETKSQHCFPLPTASPYQPQPPRKQPFTPRRDFFALQSNKQQMEGKGSPGRSSPHRESPEEWLSREEAKQAKMEAQFSAGKLRNLQGKYKAEVEKCRGETERRKALEAGEQNYKMEIIRLQLARDEQQKEMERRDAKLKEAAAENGRLREAEKKGAFWKEEARKKQMDLNFLEEKLALQGAELMELKAVTEEEINRYEAEISKLKKEADKLKKENATFSQDLKTQLKDIEQELTSLSSKCSRLEEDLTKQRKSKQQIESKNSEKVYELQKTIASLKKELKAVSEQELTLKTQLERAKLEHSHLQQVHREELEREKSNYSKLLVEKRQLEEEASEGESKLTEVKRYKDKYQQLADRYKTAREDYSRIKRKYENAQEEYHKLEERTKTVQQEHDRLAIELQYEKEKNKMTAHKEDELENQLKKLKNVAEKTKKSEDLWQREVAHLKEKERQAKTQLTKKEMQVLQLKGEVESLTSRLAQLRDHSKVEVSRRINTSYYPPEDWEDPKINNMMESQRFLEMEIMSHKQNYADLQSQLAKAREEVEKWAKIDMDWRETERGWEVEKLKLTTDNARMAKELKESVRKFGQEEAKATNLNDRLQKERKAQKQLQERIVTLESSLRKVTDDREDISSEVEAKQNRYKTLSNELIIVKGEVEYLDNEKRKYLKLNEHLEAENRRLREELAVTGGKLKEEQERAAAEGRKIREEMSRNEGRVLNFKRDNEKFKENLRNIMVESICSRVPKDQQEYDIVLKKKEDKLGLTLTNELLIRLDDYLKELHRCQQEIQTKLAITERDLVAAKEESILKTNQFQNTEAQLKIKLEEMLENLDRVNKIYEEREQELQKTIEEAEWQRAVKSEEYEQLSQLKDSLTYELASMTDKIQKSQHKQTMLNGEMERLKLRLKDQLEKEMTLLDQVTALEEYCARLEETISDYRLREEELTKNGDKASKENLDLKAQLEALQQSENKLTRQKSDMKVAISSFESQIQQLRLVNEHLEQENGSYEREKSDGAALIRNLMKEKETLLHQYLASEEQIAVLENGQFQFEDQISQLREEAEREKNGQEEARQLHRKLQAELKQFEMLVAKKEAEIKEVQEKLKEKERSIVKHQDQARQAAAQFSRQKVKSQHHIKRLNAQKLELQETIFARDSSVKELHQSIQTLQRKLHQTEHQVQQLKERIEQLNQNLQENEGRLTELIEKEQNMEIDLFAKKTELSQLREELTKTQQEIEEKDLKNFQLCSELYKVQADFSAELAQLEEKIVVQECSMLKYEEICEDYVTQIEGYKRQKEQQDRNMTDLVQQLEKANSRAKVYEQESQMTREKSLQLEAEMEGLRQAKLKMQAVRSSDQRETQEKLFELQQKIERKDTESQRIRNENDILHQMLKKFEQKMRESQHEYQNQLRKATLQIQNGKKHEQMLRKLRQDVKQTHWNNERQIKKLLQTKIRVFNDIDPKDTSQLGKASDHVKQLEQAIVQVLKKYELAA